MVCYIKIFGGLGNQLFQYSFGKFLQSINENIEIKFDISYFNNPDSHDLLINKFDIEFDTLTNNELDRFRLSVLEKILKKVGINLISSKIKYENKTFGFEKIKPRDNTLYIGYWQNTNYLKANKKLFKSIYNYSIKNNLDSNYSNIGIHVRRGDYLGIDKYNVYDDKYYIKSINLIEKKIRREKKYFIFSDEIDYCKKLFNNLKNCHFVEDTNTLDDFELMKCMDHIVISNSTFSWWAAWLSDKKNKITICPKIWMKGNENVEIIQKNWIKI